MKKLNFVIVALLLIAAPVWAGPLQEKLKAVVKKKAAVAPPAGLTSPTYFTPNTTNFDSLTYATLNGNDQIVATGASDFISSGLSDHNYYGNCANAEIGRNVSAVIYRILLKFDLSDIPATATISAVQLKIYGAAWNVAGTVEAYKLTRGYTTAAHSGECLNDNDANAVSWNEYSGTSTWTTAGGDYDTKLGELTFGENWLAFTNTAACGGGSDDCMIKYVQDVIDETTTDYGIILKASNESTTSQNAIVSDVGTNGTRFYLKVTWTD